MTHYNGSVPTAPRKTSWRDAGACRTEDPALFAPDGTTGKWAPIITKAKAVCNRCPVRPDCLAWALDTREPHGIYGGHTEDERWDLIRRQDRNARRPAKNPRGPKQPQPQTLRELLDRHTESGTGGHLMWTGAKTPTFRQRQYTPYQLAYLVDRGREWDGPIRRMCDVRGCVQPTHLADERERLQQAAQKAAV